MHSWQHWTQWPVVLRVKQTPPNSSQGLEKPIEMDCWLMAQIILKHSWTNVLCLKSIAPGRCGGGACIITSQDNLWETKHLPFDLKWACSRVSRSILAHLVHHDTVPCVSHREEKTAERYLVGGFNPSEKYMSQIGSFPQVGVKIKKYLKPP